jgi:hypothetical protein
MEIQSFIGDWHGGEGEKRRATRNGRNQGKEGETTSQTSSNLQFVQLVYDPE